jgi:hypothetical protein
VTYTLWNKGILWVNGEIDEVSSIYRHATWKGRLQAVVVKRPPNLPKVEEIVLQQGEDFYWGTIKHYYSRNYKGDKVCIVIPEFPKASHPERMPEDSIDLEAELHAH